MNGREIRLWRDMQGFPAKMLPNGNVICTAGLRNPDLSLQDQVDLVQLDWEGNGVWKFTKGEKSEDEGEEPRWMARQHHDFQREGITTG